MNFTKMNFRAMMLSLLVMLFAGSVVSCSSDNGDNSKDEPSVSIPAKGVMECYFKPSGDNLTLFDITVEYTDATGKVQTETITGEWNKTITYTTLPVNATMVVKQSLKPNVELTKDTYKVSCYENCFCTSLYSNGSIGDYCGSKVPQLSDFTIRKDDVAKYAEKNTILVKYAYTFSNKKNSDGKYIWVTK